MMGAERNQTTSLRSGTALLPVTPSHPSSLRQVFSILMGSIERDLIRFSFTVNAFKSPLIIAVFAGTEGFDLPQRGRRGQPII